MNQFFVEEYTYMNCIHIFECVLMTILATMMKLHRAPTLI